MKLPGHALTGVAFETVDGRLTVLTDLDSRSMSHYHIRWDNSELDWEAYKAEEEAKAGAERLKPPGGNYVIERFDNDCPRCKRMPNHKQA